MLLTDILALNTCVNSHCFSRMNQHSKLILDSCRTCLKQYKCLNITLNCIHKNTFRMSRGLQITVWQKKIKMIHECKFLPKGLRFDTKTVLSSNLHFFGRVSKPLAFIFRRKLRQFGHLFTQRSGAPSVRRSEKAFRCNLCKARFFETEAELDVHHSCHVPNSEGYGMILFVLEFFFCY